MLPPPRMAEMNRMTAPRSYCTWWCWLKSSPYLLSPFGWGYLWSLSLTFHYFSLTFCPQPSQLTPDSHSQSPWAFHWKCFLIAPSPINHNSDSILDQFNGLQNFTYMKPSDTSLRVLLWLYFFLPHCLRFIHMLCLPKAPCCILITMHLSLFTSSFFGLLGCLQFELLLKIFYYYHPYMELLHQGVCRFNGILPEFAKVVLANLSIHSAAYEGLFCDISYPVAMTCFLMA